MISRPHLRFALAAFAAVTLAAPIAAQSTTPDTTRAPSGTPPSTAAVPLNFSGLIFGSYNYTRPTTPAQPVNQVDNQFQLDRAYLTFRMPAGERASIRITTDVYRTAEASANPNNYAIRAKYAYLQYDARKSANVAQLLGRAGILQNVVIDHIEGFWPRYLSQTAIERAGFFGSSDVGIAGQFTLPNRMGELYATVVNGPGYASRELDRFKDFALRLSVTPLANGSAPTLLKSLTFTGWGYKGAVASTFVNGGAGQVGAVGEALDRTRYGVFAGIKDPRLVLGAEYAQRHDGGETGANTATSPRSVTETTGRVLSGFTVIRPFAFVNASGKSPLGLVARYDRVSPTTSSSNVTPAPATSNSYHNLIGGLFYDVNSKLQLALDYQESLATSNGVSSAPPAQSKGYYAHFVVNF